MRESCWQHIKRAGWTVPHTEGDESSTNSGGKSDFLIILIKTDFLIIFIKTDFLIILIKTDFFIILIKTDL